MCEASPSAACSRPDRVAVALFIGAVALRLIYLLQMTSGPYFVAPQLDELYHDLLARRVAEGLSPVEGAYFRAPLYYYALGLCYRVFGHDYFIPRLLQALWGAAGVVLVYRIGLRAFSRPVAIVAGAAAMAWPSLIFFDGELLLEPVFIPLALATLLCLQRWGEQPGGWGWLVAAGLLCGLAAITRPNILLAAPFFAAWAAWIARRSGLAWGPTLARIGILAGCVLAPILPVTARNVIVGGDPVLISSQSGINFYIGNNHAATGYTSATPRRFRFESEYEDSVALYARRQAELDLGHPLKASEVSRHWTRKTWAGIARDPAAWMRLMLKKCLLFWSAIEIKNNKDIAYVVRFSPLLHVLYWLLPFGVAGPMALAYLFGRRPTAAQALLAGFLFIYMISVVLYFVCARFREPIVPIVLIFAAGFIASAFQNLRRRQWRMLALPWGLFILFGAMAWIDFYGVRRAMAEDLPHEDWVAANGWLASGRPAEAVEFYRRALAAKPDYVEAWLNLGRACVAKGDPSAARQAFERALALDPANLSSMNNLALLADRRGERAAAHDLWRRVLASEPDFLPALLGLGESLAEGGNFAQARPLLQRAYTVASQSEAPALALARLAFLERDEAAFRRWATQATRLGGQRAEQTIRSWTTPTAAPLP